MTETAIEPGTLLFKDKVYRVTRPLHARLEHDSRTDISSIYIEGYDQGLPQTVLGVKRGTFESIDDAVDFGLTRLGLLCEIGKRNVLEVLEKGEGEVPTRYFKEPLPLPIEQIKIDGPNPHLALCAPLPISWEKRGDVYMVSCELKKENAKFTRATHKPTVMQGAQKMVSQLVEAYAGNNDAAKQYIWLVE